MQIFVFRHFHFDLMTGTKQANQAAEWIRSQVGDEKEIVVLSYFTKLVQDAANVVLHRLDCNVLILDRKLEPLYNGKNYDLVAATIRCAETYVQAGQVPVVVGQLNHLLGFTSHFDLKAGYEDMGCGIFIDTKSHACKYFKPSP